MNQDAAGLREAYRQRGIGEPLAAGSFPAVLVVDFINGFTDPVYPTGFSCDDAVESTAELLATARAIGRPIIFTTIVIDTARRAHSV